MARSTKNSTQTPLTDELAQQVSEEVSRLVHNLTNTNFTEINSIMENEGGEISLSFKVQLTNRPAEEGNASAKDSRIKAVLSYSRGKCTDVSETVFPDPSQPGLPLEPEP